MSNLMSQRFDHDLGRYMDGQGLAPLLDAFGDEIGLKGRGDSPAAEAPRGDLDHRRGCEQGSSSGYLNRRGRCFTCTEIAVES
jgi:hypothetical protein